MTLTTRLLAVLPPHTGRHTRGLFHDAVRTGSPAPSPATRRSARGFGATVASAAEIEPNGVEWEPNYHPQTLSPGSGRAINSAGPSSDDTGRAIDHSQQHDVESLRPRQARTDFAPVAATHGTMEYAEHDWLATRLRLEPDTAPPDPLKEGKHRALVLIVAVPLDPVQDNLHALAATLIGLTLTILTAALFASRAVCRRGAGSGRADGKFRAFNERHRPDPPLTRFPYVR